LTIVSIGSLGNWEPPCAPPATASLAVGGGDELPMLPGGARPGPTN
jgi:hypothetical protein